MNYPFISVIICTYNRWKSLRNTLQSLCEQAVFNKFSYEIIVVDNNSNDKTREVVNDFKNKMGEKLKYIFEKKQGKAYALNTGVRKAKGKIIAFTDDDVIVDKYWLNNMYEAYLKYQPDGVGGKVLPLFTCNPPNWLPDNMEIPLTVIDHGEKVKVLDKPTCPGCNISFLAEICREIGQFRTDLGPQGSSPLRRYVDIEFLRRVIKAGKKVIYHPRVVVYHLVPKERLTKRFFRKSAYWRGRSIIIQNQPPISKWIFKQTLIDLWKIILLFKDSMIFGLKGDKKREMKSQTDICYYLGSLHQLWIYLIDKYFSISKIHTE